MSRLKRFLRSPDQPERRLHRRAEPTLRIPAPPRPCDHCGCLLPKDVGAWRVTIIDDALKLVCSIECGAQLEDAATLAACREGVTLG